MLPSAPVSKQEESTYLHSALDDIEWADSSVCDTAGEDSSEHALLVVFEVVNFAHFKLEIIIIECVALTTLLQ